MDTSEYRVKLTLVADLDIPEGKTGASHPEQTWRMEVGSLSEVAVPAYALAEGLELYADGFEAERLQETAANAFVEAVNLAAAIEHGEMDHRRAIDLARQQGLDLQFCGGFGEAEFGRLMEMGLVPMMKAGES